MIKSVEDGGDEEGRTRLIGERKNSKDQDLEVEGGGGT